VDIPAKNSFGGQPLSVNICPDNPVASAGSATAVWQSGLELSGRIGRLSDRGVAVRI